MVWWVELGYPPFDRGKGGFPRTGQIVKHYREQNLDESGKALTQGDLARLLNITEQAVGNLESRDASMDADRRRFLCKFLGIPPILFGIVTLEEILKMVEQRRANADAPAFSSPLWTPHKATLDTTEYHGHLVSLWNTHHSHTAYRAMADTLLRINTLYREFSLVSAEEWPQLQETLCEYHQFVAHLLRDK